MPTARLYSFAKYAGRNVALAGAVSLVAFGLTACKSNPAPIVNNAAADPGGPDPADANMASASGQPTQVMGQSQSYASQQQGQSYSQPAYSQQSYPSGQQAPAPIVQGNTQYVQQGYADNGQAGYYQGYADGEAAEAATAPPPLPSYEQPPAPDPNDIWTPGYWNYGPAGYYWVPGVWVAAPYYGALWTPPYWGWYGGHYLFHHGYWGPHIGFYGGIDYGFGYIGVGYYGGYWRGHDFFYNRAVNNVGRGFGNVYERNVVVNNVRYNAQPSVRTSFNGGPGGINARPGPAEAAADRERHEGPVAGQMAVRQAAAGNRGNSFAANGGHPEQAALAHSPVATGGVAGRPGEAGGARPGEVGGNRPGVPGAQPMNRPGEFGGIRPGSPAAQPGSRPGEPAGRPAMGANPAVNHGAEPGNRPGGFNAQANHAAAAPQHVGQPAAGQAIHGGEPGGRPAGAPAGGFNRPAQAPQQHMEAPRAAPQQRMEAPHAAPQQHMEAPQQHMEAPRAAPAPHVEAPHAAPAGGGGHPEGGGGHPGGGGGHPGPHR